MKQNIYFIAVNFFFLLYFARNKIIYSEFNYRHWQHSSKTCGFRRR